MRIFISHASQNEWVATQVTTLIREQINPKAEEVFCSSEACIGSGENYKEAIYRSLKNADVFVAILSHEYWKSKYCVFELGAAYERYRYDSYKKVTIQPLLLPPLEKGMALANTPLVEMQVVSLTKADELMLFFQKLLDPDGPYGIDTYEPYISELASNVRERLLLQKSLTRDMEANAYYDELPRANIVRDRVVRCQTLEDDVFLFEFRLSQLEYEPGFASVALQYYDLRDLREYLAFDSDAKFCATISNSGGVLRAITVEFKVGREHMLFRAFDFKLVEGTNLISVPLSKMNYRDLEEIKEICFVVHPKSMNALDGEIYISDVGVDFARKNLLAS